MKATLRHIYLCRTANMSWRTCVVVKQIQSNQPIQVIRYVIIFTKKWSQIPGNGWSMLDVKHSYEYGRKEYLKAGSSHENVHIETETKWLPFRRRQVQLYFLEWKWMNLSRLSLNFVLKVRIDNIPAMVQIMTWFRTGDKPLSEPMMAYVGKAYMRHSASMSWTMELRLLL